MTVGNPAPIDPIASAVEQMRDNIVNSPTNATPLPDPAAAAAGDVTPAVRTADASGGLNADGSLKKKRGRPSHAELAARATTQGAPPPADAAPTAEPITPLPAAPLLNLSADPAAAASADPQAALDAAQAAVDRKNIERSARVSARAGVVTLRMFARIIAGERIPFDEGQKEEIMEAIEHRVRENEISFIPAEVELFALVTEYLSKAGETEVGKKRLGALREWAAARWGWLMGKMFKAKAAA